MIQSHRARSARRGLAAVASAVLVAGLTAVAVQLVATPATAQHSDPYEWSNVEIVGGGFVPNIIFSETEPDLIYARTDVGGAYRWNQSTQRWIPLLDWVGWDKWGWNGVSSLATDPRDSNRVYAAVGMYTNDWDPNNGAILRSTNRGNSWQATELPFKLGGNMPGRGVGERLAVDPHNNAIVYFGAPEGNGLWRSTNFGQTWFEVTSFPNPGNWSQQPGDPYLGAQPGVMWVTFDPRTGSTGSTTQTVYVGVADLENTVYRSTDGGSSWQRLAGQPTGFMAQKGVLDHVSGDLYIATSDNAGPYDGSDGEVWRYDTAGGTWTEITPLPFGGDEPYFGYSGLSVDRQDPGTLMVTGYSSWWPDTWMWRSTDSGATWTSFYDVQFPNRTNRYALDISAAPWLTYGTNPQPPEQTPKLGWMTQGLAIDPHNSNRMIYTGPTVYGTTNLTALDSGGTVNFRVMAQGMEETAVLALAKPPGGALLSGMLDLGGFRHTSLTQVPSLMYQQPNHIGTVGIDYAELNPSWVVRVGHGAEGVPHIGFSSNSGASWWAGTDPGGVTDGGSVAVNANATRVVWSPEGTGVHYSTSVGGPFSPSSGVPAGATVASDRVNPNRFYAYANGTLYVSSDGGESFTAAASGLPTEEFVSLKAVPGLEGHVWFAGQSGLLRSTNGGSSVTTMGGSTWAYNVGFGAAAPGQSHPAVYTVATIGGVTGVFRSDNAGADWVRINDDQHQWGNMGGALTGDPDVYGRVYLGTNGRGVLYGDRTGPAPSPSVSPSTSPSASPPASPSASPSVSPSASPSASPSGGPPGGCTVRYSVAGQWQGGFQGEVVIANTSSSPVNGWTLRWSYSGGQQITQLWNGSYTQSGAAVSVTSASWNGTIGAGGSVSFGFLGSRTGSNPDPTAFTLNDTSCSVS